MLPPALKLLEMIKGRFVLPQQRDASAKVLAAFTHGCSLELRVDHLNILHLLLTY